MRLRAAHCAPHSDDEVPVTTTDRFDAIRVALTALQMRLDLLRVRVDGVARRVAEL